MNKRAIILLFIANAISGIAQGMSMIAIPWYFAQQESLQNFGQIYIIATVISLFWMPLSGTIVDKYDRKKIFLFLTFIVGSLIALISVTGLYYDGLSLYSVGLVFILTFLNYNLHYPCLYAFIQEIIESKNYSRISSLLEIIGQVTTISAGAGATLLLEGTQEGILRIFSLEINVGLNLQAWKIYEIFALDACTYFLAFIIISFIKYTPLKERKPEEGSFLGRFIQGWNYLKSDRAILIFGVFSFIVFLAVLLEAFYLGVSYVNNHLLESGDVYANSKMAYSMGAIFIGLTIASLFKRWNIPIAIILMTLFMSLIFMSLASTKSVLIFFALMFAIGICNAGIRIGRMTYLFKNVPNQYFGRAAGVFFIVNVVVRIILMLIFTQDFYQTGNNIIYAYMILSVILMLAAFVLIKYYKQFDLSLSP